MGSFSGLGIGLSFVFGCILMGLVAELYYLLWWKKRITNSEIQDDLSFLFCWKKPTSFNSSQEELTTTEIERDLEMEMEIGPPNTKKEQFPEEGIEQELMRVHNLNGPPRFLFTIKEESREDLESEDGRSRKGSRARSLSDIVGNGTPFLTPISSPILKPSLDSYNHHDLNPLFESISEAELNKLRSSPPPKFKFLKDAEDKLLRKMLMEESGRKMEGFVSVRVASQVLPLPCSSSPTFQNREITV